VPQQERVFDFKRANVNAIVQDLNGYDWNDLCKDRNVNEFVCIFQGIMKESFERHVPLSIKRTSRKKPWFTKDLCNLRNRKTKVGNGVKGNG
jgi:hypothetical protein